MWIFHLITEGGGVVLRFPNSQACMWYLWQECGFVCDKDLILPVLTGPEFGGQKNCVYIGMVTEDLDVSELVETIAATGREIEENSRVRINKSQSIPAPLVFPFHFGFRIWFCSL